MAYAVVRTDKMFGTDNRAGMYSVKYMGSGSTATAIENGNVVLLDGLMAKDNSSYEREVYKGTTPQANSGINKIVLIATPEVTYLPTEKSLEDFINGAGEISRAYALHSGDIFSVTAEALDGIGSSTAAGDIVELQGSTKLKVVTSATSGSTTVGSILDIETVGRYTYYVIQVD